MDTSLTNNYYLQFNEKYFVARRNSKRGETNMNDTSVRSTKAGMLGRKIFKGIFRTLGEILVIGSLLAVCKYAGIYDVWVQFIDTLV